MTMNFHPDPFEPTREDVLIGRVVDGEASTADWDSLETIARTDAAVWERLGRAQRTHARLEREVEDAIAVAELIDVPSAHAISITSFQTRMRQWGGWAAAAVIGVAWIGFSGITGSGRPGGPIAGGSFNQVQELSPDDLLSQYMRKGTALGRVVSEMPTMLVEARDLGDGRGKEVFFVRPILERTTVTDLAILSVQKDEHGTPRYVPIPATLQSEFRPAAEQPATNPNAL